MKKIILAVLCTVFLGSAAAQASTEFEGMFEFKEADNQFSIELKEGKTVSEKDIYSVTILKPGAEFKENATASYFVDSIFKNRVTKGLPADRIVYNYSFSNADTAGWYQIKVARTKVNGDYDQVIYRTPKVASESLSNAKTAFQNATKDTFITVYNQYAATMFNIADYPEIGQYAALMGQQFVYIRDGYNGGAEFTSISQIFEALKKTVVLYAMDNLGQTKSKEIIDKYGFLYLEIFDTAGDYKALYDLYQSAKGSITSSADFVKQFKKIAAMANMQNGAVKKTPQNIADAINKYSAEMGIDLQYAKDANIEINAVAVKINPVSVITYFNDSDWFTGIVDNLKVIAGGNTNQTVTKPNNSSGGTGTGSVPKDPVVIPDSGSNSGSAGGDVGGASDSGDIFNDISNISWAREAIEALYNENIIAGVGGGRFAPNRNVKREEFVKMLVIAFSLAENPDNTVSFKDVPAGAWFESYVRCAASLGITTGIGNEMFGVGADISRQDMAVMLLHVMKTKDNSIVPQDVKYADSESIAGYARLAVKTMTHLGVMNGFNDGTFKPREKTTRAQAATVIYRMMQYLG